jgi:hypothetical protein
MNYPIHLLERAVDLESRRPPQPKPLLLKNVRRDNRVGKAGFIFQRHEEESLCGSGALADDHDACDRYPGTADSTSTALRTLDERSEARK